MRLGNTSAVSLVRAADGEGEVGGGGPRRRAASVRGPTVGRVAGRPVHADGDGQRWPRVDRLVLRGVVPGELGLGWGPGGCKGCRGGGKPERDEQPVRVAGVSDEGHDAATAAARASQNVVGEHPAEQLSPRQPVGTRRDGLRGTWAGSLGGVAGGRHQRAELGA